MSAWFPIVQTAGIIGGLVFSGLALRTATRSSRTANLIQITAAHRDIWRHYEEHPELAQLFDDTRSGSDASEAERLFVSQLILHLAATYEAARSGALVPLEGLALDVRHVFRLPVPFSIWQELRPYQNRAFVKFVDDQARRGRAQLRTLTAP